MFRHLAAGLAALFMLPVAVLARPPSDEQIIGKLNSEDVRQILDGLEDLADRMPYPTNVLVVAKKHLGHPTAKVRYMAARTLTMLRPPLDAVDAANVIAMLKSGNYEDVSFAAKLVRGVKLASVAPVMRDLLGHSQERIVREALRTMGVIGARSDIALIEPFLRNASRDVAKDAKDAIYQLKALP